MKDKVNYSWTPDKKVVDPAYQLVIRWCFWSRRSICNSIAIGLSALWKIDGLRHLVSLPADRM